jgi:phosphatidate cytidylyltransferase
MAGGESVAKKSDLGVRVASALVMIAVAGTALWLGGWVWTAFVAAVALGVLWEWWGLVSGFEPSPVKRSLWSFAGLIYIGIAAFLLIRLRTDNEDMFIVLVVVGCVIATDIGAYFVGRRIGGPKIAPRISPSKTWSGLVGGMLGAGAVMFVANWHFDEMPLPLAWLAIPVGALLAIVAQAGDFFESWMKRCAGVKDSGSLIPGHGGLFDRVDGLLAVSFVIGVLSLHSLFISE